MDQLIVPVDPKEPVGEVRCIACDHRWPNIAEVQARDFTTCPEVFHAKHVGGFSRLADTLEAPPPIEPSDDPYMELVEEIAEDEERDPHFSDFVRSGVAAAKACFDYNMGQVTPEEAKAADEAEAERTWVECPSCTRCKSAATEADEADGEVTYDDVFCMSCASMGAKVGDKQKTLICTVGLPRSGKSTWARNSGYPVVNPDAIRWALYGRDWYYPAEAWVWAIAGTMVEALFGAGHKVVVLDATNVSADRRQHWIDKYGAENIVWKIFRTPASVCRDRATKLNQPDLLPVIDKMERLWDVDDPKKGIKSSV